MVIAPNMQSVRSHAWPQGVIKRVVKFGCVKFFNYHYVLAKNVKIVEG